MWRNPRYPLPEEPPAPSPPLDRGRRLATIARGPFEELRINLDEYQGHPFVSVRLWTRSMDGRGVFWPSKKGLSIRMRELEEVIEALTLAAEES